MTEMVKKILVIGMGNILMQDEGIGVRAVEELENRYRLPRGVTVIDGGTTGMGLFEPMRDCDHLIVADAVNTGAPGGTLVRIADAEIPAFFQTKLSNHQLGLSDLLALLKLKHQQPETMAIIGMVPYSLENKLGLTAEADHKLDLMVAMLVEELASLAVNAQQRKTPGIGPWRRKSERQAMAACA